MENAGGLFLRHCAVCLDFFDDTGIQESDEDFDDFRIELGAGTVQKLFPCARFVHHFFIMPAAHQRIIYVGHRNDTADNRNPFSGKAQRVSFSIVSLMVIAGPVLQIGYGGDGRQDICTNRGMLLDLVIFLRGKPALF